MPSLPRANQRGFTLIEMLVAAPIIIIFIGITIGLISNLTKDSLISGVKNELIYQAQDALDTIEVQARYEMDKIEARKITWRDGPSYDVRQADGIYGAHTFKSPSSAPTNNRFDYATSNSVVLALKTPATDRNPGDPNRQLVQICPTGNPNGTPIGPLPIYYFYFVNNGTLYQRTIQENVATSPLCGNATPWQRNTCARDTTLTGACVRHDDQLTSEGTFVRKFQVSYKESEVTIDLELMKIIAGEGVTNGARLTIPL